MTTDLRKTGINIVGDMPWGTHFCHFYETKQDLLDTLVPYFKAGLENKEYCLWVVSDSDLITVEEAKGALAQVVPDLDRHLSDESLEILNGHDWYFEKNVLNLERVKNAWDAKLKRALARGYEGLRASGDTFWLAEKDWKDFFAYEKQVNDWITHQAMTVLCTYPLAKSGATEVLDVVQAHQFAMARRQGVWEVIETPELIQAKAEIRKLNKELEQRVIERTEDLRKTNQELRTEITERKRAEAYLHAKDQEFRAIVENAPDQIIRYDREFRRTYVNPAVAKACGLSAEALIGKPIFSIIRDAGLDIKEDELAQIRQRLEDVFDTGKSCEFEVTLPMPTGRRYYSVRFFPELDLNDSVINVLGIARDITERRIAEEELKKEKEILEKIFDNIPVMIGFIGEDGCVKLVNPEWERTIGWTLKELEEQKVDIFVEAYPDLSYRQEVLDFVAAATGEWVDLKIKVRDGRVIEAACAIVHVSDGTKVAIAQDITERKRAENELRAQKEILQTIFDHIPIMIRFRDAIGLLPLVNREYEGTLGWSLEEIQKHDIDIFAECYPDLLERQRVLDFITAATGEWADFKTRVRDGRVIDTIFANIRLADGTTIGIGQDISERKQAERALRRSEDHLRLVIDTIPTMAWSLRPDGAVDFVNQRWLDYTGLSLDDAIQQSNRTVHPEDLPSVVEKWLTDFAAGEPFEDEMRLRRTDGEYRWFLVRTAPLRDEEGNIVKWYGTGADITERKQAEENLKATSEQLRALSARLGSAREEESTRIAREIHDELGSALSSLRWDLEDVDEVISEATDLSHLATLHQKVEAMMRLTDTTVHTLRRIASELRPVALDELGLVEAIKWQAQQFQDRTGIFVECDCQLEDLALNREVSTGIFRIFQETLTNILRHAKAGRVEVMMKQEADEFILMISDNGKGITDDEKSGTQSLGLLGMRERAHLLGGEINFEGAQGQGTVVTVRVPIQAKPTSGIRSSL